MSKKIFYVGIPCIFIGILIIVVMGIYGLNNMDKVLAEENAREAFIGVYEEFVDSEVDVTKFLNLYKNDKFSHSGSFSFEETELLDNSYASLLKGIPVDYSIIRCPAQRVTSASIALKGDGYFQADGYVDDDSITFKIDKLYDGYFTLPNSNIKENYNESLWFSLLGDVMSPLPEGFSLDLYPQLELKDYVLSDYLKKCSEKGMLTQILDGISVEKTAVQKDFFVGSTYIAANEYAVSVSKSAMEDITELIVQYLKIDEEDIWEADKTEFLAYIAADNRLLGIKLNFAISYNDIPYDTEVLLSFAGAEGALDKTVVDIFLKGQDNSVYSFRILFTNRIEEEEHEATLIIAMNQPYVSRLCEVKLNRDIVTNEASLNAAVNIPGLKGSINYTGALYEGEITSPAEDAYNIYELNLWQILNIYSSTNWSFIK